MDIRFSYINLAFHHQFLHKASAEKQYYSKLSMLFNRIAFIADISYLETYDEQVFFKFFYALVLLILCDAGSILGNNWPGKIEEVKCIERERQALLSFQKVLNDAWGILSTWRNDQNNSDCCKWKGIECSNETGHVLKLDLRGGWHLLGLHRNYLICSTNYISSLIDLQNLEYLDLSSNWFYLNHIPELIGSFAELRYLNLSGSLVGGSIPHQLGKLEHLQYLDLGNNYYLEGGIPYQLRNLGQLLYLDLGGNDLSGAIPFQIGDLPMLHTLKLDGEFDIKTKDVEWLSNLSSLTNLVLRSLPLHNSHHWLQMISKRIPNLSELRLTNCRLSDKDIPSLFDSYSNFSTSLTILDLSYNMLTSLTFQLLSNFSNNLQELYLLDNNIVLLSPLYPNLPSLAILDLSYNNLTSSIFQGNFNFSSKLEELYLQDCSLTDRSFFIVPSSSTMDSSSSLVSLHLSHNKLTSLTIFNWLFNFTTNLRGLYLDNNLLECPIPDDFGKVMSSLEYLDLTNNTLQGEVPASLGNICTLQTLLLSHNNLGGKISSFIQNSSWCNRHVFRGLDLSHNQITGMLPKSIELLFELEYLDLHRNSLEGKITESNLTNLSKLKFLYLSYNVLSLNFVPSWVPPFQLISLGLASCKLGPSFPSWLQTQSHLAYLDISQAEISDSVPEWFWNNLQYVRWLNMSHNNFIGAIPNLPLKLSFPAYMYLYSNQFDGVVPSFLLQASALFLSENKFSDLSSLLCDNNITGRLVYLVLANNQIEGQLPDCWGSVNSLSLLDLSNNNLSGKIPPSVGTLSELKTLVLGNNKLIGELPSTLKNCSNLFMLDVGENLLSGLMPSWIGESLQQLMVLSMKGNHFFGNLSMHLCYLKQIKVLDLSRNNLSNGIPTCLKNFIAMSTKSINSNDQALSSIYYPHNTYHVSFYISGYQLNITLMWKGVECWIKDPELRLIIDFSSNHLTGKIPREFGYLIGVVSLNLSRNNLSGEIPSEIGNLTSLDFLDLSRNHLFGKIPPTLSQIDRLSVLNLSYNSLSGRIPFGRQLQTFGVSSFEGNLDLCGDQLNISCPEDMTPVKPQEPLAHDKDENSTFYEALYMSMGLGFFIGFWGILGPILLWRPWRSAYLSFLNKLID